MSTARIEQVFREAAEALEQFRSRPENLQHIAQAAELMLASLKAGGKIISCGNGGSMCDAMHFAEELSGRFRDDRPAIAALSISDPSHISCVANDFGFDYVFSRYIEAVGKAGDVLLAISTSGNSRNVLNAAEAARRLNMKVVALTGKDGGQLAAMADVEIRATHSTYADRAQEIHIKVIHALIDQIEQGMYAGRK
jgi:D-sedoheptulose 7-phosphate isomerase